MTDPTPTRDEVVPMASTVEPDFVTTLMGAASMAESEARDETDEGKTWTLNFLAGKLRDAAFVITTQKARIDASAPAPASGGVDVVAVKPVVWEKYWGGSNDDIPSWRASTPVGLTLDVDFAGERLEKHSDADPARLAAKQADAFAWYEQSIRSALSPAATPVSEAGGGPTYVANCCNCGRIVDTREAAEGGDDFGSELADGERWVCSPECWDAVVEPALAKPALAKPASSPAGGDVVEAATAFDKLVSYGVRRSDRHGTGTLFLLAGGHSFFLSDIDRDAIRAALSQSTSAGRAKPEQPA